MKKSFSAMPDNMKSMEEFFNLTGFSWMEFVTAIPSPVFLVTSYKSNGAPNTCLQSWDMVINLPHAALWEKCGKTIQHNHLDDDEIIMAGLTVEETALVNAPLIQECFVNLECKIQWEKD